MNEAHVEPQQPERVAGIKAEVARVLSCIEKEADHYNVLGIKRDATSEDIRGAYRTAVERVHPLNCKDIIEADGAMRWKLSQALLRVIEAFSALASPARKIEYDSTLNRRPSVPIPIPPVPKDITKGNGLGLDNAPDEISNASNSYGLGLAFGLPNHNIAEVKDRRESKRLALKIPVRVSSVNGDWVEVTESRNVSRMGIQVWLSRKVDSGECLQFEMPMPLALRSRDYNRVQYVINGEVRHVVSCEANNYLVGIRFKEGV